MYHSADTRGGRDHILVLYLHRDVIRWVPGRHDLRVWIAGLSAGYYELGRNKPAFIDSLVAVRTLCTDLRRRQHPSRLPPTPNADVSPTA